MTRQVWCEWAVIDGVAVRGVTVTIDGQRFSAIDTHTVAPPGCEQRLGVTLPGLANAHSHAFHRALRHRTHADGGTFWTWREQMYRAAARLDPDNYFLLARATFAEMVCAGITCVGEFHYVHHQPDGTPYATPAAMSEAVLAAAAEAGLRITLLDTLYLHGGLDRSGHLPLSAGQQRFSDLSVDRWQERLETTKVGDGQRLGAAIHSVRAVDPESIRQAADWAAARQTVLHVHASEQPAENDACRMAFDCTPIQLLARHGALGPSTVVVHATHLASGDVVLLGGSRSAVCVCPTTEADLADGIGPTAELAEGGISLSVGTDSNAVIDVLAETRAVELDQRLASGQRGVFAPSALVDIATVAGHRALGWHDAGQLRVGEWADLVTVALNSTRTAGGGDPLSATLFAGSAADITTVTSGGSDVVTGGHHRTLDVVAELQRSISGVID